MSDGERDRIAALVRIAWEHRPSDHWSWTALEEEFDLLGVQAARSAFPSSTSAPSMTAHLTCSICGRYPWQELNVRLNEEGVALCDGADCGEVAARVVSRNQNWRPGMALKFSPLPSPPEPQ